MSILSKLQALLTAANTKTGESDTTLTDAMQTLVDGYGQGGGSGLTTIASGTYTGTGINPTSAGQGIFIGTKMPKTDFYFRYTARSDSEFVYDTDYKYAHAEAMVFSDMGYFDLSTVGNGKEIISNRSYAINNSGEITQGSSGVFYGTLVAVRNAVADNKNLPNNFRIDRTTDGFYLRLYISNVAYYFPEGIVYDWEVVYFGSNPSTDIIEIS